jgi:hypothetical protein
VESLASGAYHSGVFHWLTKRVKRERRQLTDRELAEEETIRREAEQARLRGEAQGASDRAAIEARITDGFGGH